ncbi:MAG: hypothetical protein AB7R00_30060 [Kofleriaceae bacterium]
MTSWVPHAWLAGIDSAEQLGGLPLSGDIGDLFWPYLARLNVCGSEIETLQGLYATLRSSRGLDDAIVVSPEVTSMLPTVLTALASCTAPTSPTLDQLLRSHRSTDPVLVNYIETGLLPDEQSMLALPAIEAMIALVEQRRSKLREIESTFTTSTGRPWSAVRYYSSEEQADDVSVHASLAAALIKPGVSGFMLSMLDTESARCEALLAAGKPYPYGVNLLDDHHANCWRVGHARQVAAETARRVDDGQRTKHEPWVPTRAAIGPVY